MRKSINPVCAVEHCEAVTKARGLCSTHYTRWRKTGTTATGKHHHKPAHMTDIEWFWSRFDLNGPAPAHCPELGPCHIWTGRRGAKGYGAVNPLPSLENKETLVHRIAFILTYGLPPQDAPLVLHKCDTPLCGNTAHLRAGTNAENIADRQAKGRQARGRTHASRLPFTGVPRANRKLSPQDVRDIRRLYKPRVVTRAHLAEKYGVSVAAIKDLLSGFTWQDIR